MFDTFRMTRTRPTRHEDGQVLVIAAMAMGAIIMMLALLFDGAHGLLLKRQMQNATDAAALAGVNLVQTFDPMGCSADKGPPPGPPRAEVVQAVLDSLAANLPDFDPNDVVVTCPADTGDNLAVLVELVDRSPNFFGGIFGSDGLTVLSRSGAVNGVKPSNSYSVLTLNPNKLLPYYSYPAGTPDTSGWQSGKRGCPSVLLSGGPSVQFDSAVYIDSSCTLANGGALSTNGNAATLQMGDGVPIRIVGQYAPGALTIDPPPWENQPYRTDPYLDLAPPSVMPDASTTVRSNSKLIINGDTNSTVLRPGIYKGGIELRSDAEAYLEPGIYVMKGGGLKLGAQSSLYSINQNAGPATTTNWDTKCTVSDCGILVFNTCSADTIYCPSSGTSMQPVDINAGAVVKIRGYNPDAAGVPAPVEDYRNLLFWQNRYGVPTSSYSQPPLSLIGGGEVDMTGTVYAPSAKVYMTGTSGGGSGAAQVTLTLQFISWELEIAGNANFHFKYWAELWSNPWGYGLYH